MRQWILMALFTGLSLWTGCDKSKEVTAPVEQIAKPVEIEPWQLRANELNTAVKVGMTEDEVLNVAGDPKMVKTGFGGQVAATWQYELGGGNWYTVQFDKSNRVANAEPDTPVRIQH